MIEDVRWSFRRTDVVRAMSFLVAAAGFGAAALGLRSIESTSGRVVPIIFTVACIAGGAVLGFVLSVVELVSGARVETADAATDLGDVVTSMLETGLADPAP